MLAIERIVRASPAGAPPERPPLVTSIADGQRLMIAAACAKARALGIAPGQPLAQAQAMVTGLDIRPADPLGDEALVARIADHAARRWTPLAAADPPDGLWLDITGVAHLVGGELRLAAAMQRRLARAGLSTRIAIADCYGAAHGLARWSKDAVTIVPPGDQAQAIACLPIAALRIDAEIRARLARLGIETISELLAMPRAPLARRFGMTLLARLDQAIGRAAEPIAALIPSETPTARRAGRRNGSVTDPWPRAREPRRAPSPPIAERTDRGDRSRLRHRRADAERGHRRAARRDADRQR
jgi:protein ImuB